jgi:hypothetical protein
MLPEESSFFLQKRTKKNFSNSPVALCHRGEAHIHGVFQKRSRFSRGLN